MFIKGYNYMPKEPVRNSKEHMWKERRKWGLCFD
jgi:hypothetical protein